MAEISHETDQLVHSEAATIRAGLERVLASDTFRGAPQLSSFLSFVVESSLEGRGSELKGYTIAVEALGRPADFDPQSDPIVRVEAGRLRKALRQYYTLEGADDPLRISMPVGAYVPVFEPNDPSVRERDAFDDDSTDAEEGAEAQSIARAAPARRGAAWLKRWPVLAVGALVLTLLLPAGSYRNVPVSQPVPVDPATQQTRLSEQATRLAGTSAPSHLPVLAVTMSVTAADPALNDIVRAFTRPLVDALARFDDLVAIKAPADGVAVPDGVDYVFEMNANRLGDAVEGFGRLRSVRDGRIVWTTSTSRTLAKGADDPALTEIARRLAIRLAEPFGIIYADFRQAAPSSPTRCIVKAFNLRRAMKAEDHLAARSCLEAVIEKDPAFHPAWSQLALVTLEEYGSGFNPLPESPALDRALAAALTAVRLAPSSARAQQAMMDAQFSSGAIEDALKSGQEALTRNPYDPDIMADLGARYVQLNRPAEGLPLLQRAIELSSGRPSWYDFFAFLGAHLMGAIKLSDTHAAILVADETPFSLLGRALLHARKGDDAALAVTLRRLAQVEPPFGRDARLYLTRKGFSEPVIDRIVEDLGSSRLAALGTRAER